MYDSNLIKMHKIFFKNLYNLGIWSLTSIESPWMASMNFVQLCENISLSCILMHFFLREYSQIFIRFGVQRPPKWIKSRSSPQRRPQPPHWNRWHWKPWSCLGENQYPHWGSHSPQREALLCLKQEESPPCLSHGCQPQGTNRGYEWPLHFLLSCKEHSSPGPGSAFSRVGEIGKDPSCHWPESDLQNPTLACRWVSRLSFESPY